MVNRVILLGNLGRDAELRYTAGGTPVSTLNLATTEVWRDKGGTKQERTEWHRVVLWGKVAESLSEYLIKGKQVYIEGRISTRKWEDKDGNDRYTTEIRGDQIRLLGGGGSRNGGGQRRQQSGNSGQRRQQPDQQAGGDYGFGDDGDQGFGGDLGDPVDQAVDPATGELADDDMPPF